MGVGEGDGEGEAEGEREVEEERDERFAGDEEDGRSAVGVVVSLRVLLAAVRVGVGGLLMDVGGVNAEVVEWVEVGVREREASVGAGREGGMGGGLLRTIRTPGFEGGV